MSVTVTEGEVLAGKFRVEQVLGQGGMGVVLAATHLTLGQKVAIKVLLEGASQEVIARFLREARAAARLSGDPHIVTIYDVGEAGGRPYLVMEYLPGGSLASRLAAGRIDQGLALQWLDQAASVS